MNLTVVLEPSDDGGFTAVVPSLPGCISEGDTREEAVANVCEAIELYLEHMDEGGEFSERAELVEVAVRVRSLPTIRARRSRSQTRRLDCREATRRSGWQAIKDQASGK